MKHFLAGSVRWLVLAVILSCIGFAQVTPSADSYTNTASTKTNYGAATTLDVDGATEVTYIQFNLASIPSTANVSQATLKLYVNSVTTAGSFNVDYVNGTWAESTIDASNAPPLGATITSGVSITTASKNQYILINVTSAVQAWLSGSETNDGLALVADGTFNATFDSKENTTTSHPPELDIAYASAEGTITGVATANGSGLTGGGTNGTLNLGLTNACSSGQVLQWNGSAWACASMTGSGTVTSIATSTGLLGGPITTSGTLTIDPSVVPQLNAANTFTANQNVQGNLQVLVGDVQLQTGNLDLPQTASATMGVITMGGAPFISACCANNTFNTFIGEGAGNFTTSASGNTALGYDALTSMNNLQSTNNTAVGTTALKANLAGASNTAVGVGALLENTYGTSNTALGASALQSNSQGVWNTAVGQGAGSSNITGNSNTFIGQGANPSSGGLTNSTAIGANAVVGESNALVLGAPGVKVGIGTSAPAYTLDVQGSANFTGLVTFASGQTFPGAGTITGVTNGTGLTGGGTSGNVTLNVDPTQIPFLNSANNTFTGNQLVTGNVSATGVVTGSSFQIGSNLFDYGSYASLNAFLGFAGNTTMTGVGNTAVGALALVSNTSGADNSAIGPEALTSNTSGSGNTATGVAASVYNISGNYNVADGFWALAGGSGYSNAGNNNTAAGAFALEAGQGSNNTGLGFQAGNSPGVMMTGSNNTFVGANTNAANQTTLNNATAIGANAEVTNSNSLVLGGINGVNGATTDTSVGIGTTAPRSKLEVAANLPNALGPTVTLTNNGGYGQDSLDFNTTPPSSAGTYNPMARIEAVDDNNYSDHFYFQSNIPGSLNGGLQTNMVILSNGNVGIGTTTPQYNLDVHGAANFTGVVNFAPNQTFPGAGNGTITSVTPGAGLTGGGTSGNVTLANTGVLSVTAGTGISVSSGQNPTIAITPTTVPQLNAANTFAGNQTIGGNLVISGSGNGIQFADGSIQTSAATGSGSGVPSGYIIFGTSPIPPPGYSPAPYTITPTAAWTTEPALPNLGNLPVSGCASGGTAWVASAGGAPNLLENVTGQTFNASTNTWSTGGSSFTIPVITGTPGVACLNGNVYVIGGTTGDSAGTLTANQIFNTASSTWTTGADMPTARTRLGLATVDGLIYAIGGLTSAPNTLPYTYTAAVEVFNPSTNTWSTGVPLPQPLSCFGVAVSNGIVYVIGGFNSSNGGTTPVNTVYNFNPAVGTWSTNANLPSARGCVGAAADSNGYIYAVGGQVSYYSGGAGETDVYNPASDSWTQDPSLPSPVVGPAVVALLPGLILAVQGYTLDGPTSQVEQLTFTGEPGTVLYSYSKN